MVFTNMREFFARKSLLIGHGTTKATDAHNTNNQFEEQALRLEENTIKTRLFFERSD
jgi:hypothetical protein